MAKIHQAPPLLVQSKMPILAEVKTNKINDPEPAVWCVDTENYPSPLSGDNIIIDHHEVITLIFHDTPQLKFWLPTKGTMNDNDYTNALIASMKNIEALDDFDIVKKTGPLGISLFAKNPNEPFYNGAITTTSAGVSVAFFNHQPQIATAFEGLHLVWKLDVLGKKYKIQASDYSLTTRTALLDFQSYFEFLQPQPPDITAAYSLEPTLSTPYTFRFADKYLDTSENMTQSPELFALYGKTPNWHKQEYPLGSPVAFSCHLDDQVDLSEDQPDWWYIYFRQTDDYSIKLFCYDASDNLTKNEVIHTDNFRIGEVFSFAAGAVQLNLPFGTVRYQLQLTDAAGDVSFLGRSYSIRQDAFNKAIVLMSNGVGGCETFCFSGLQKIIFTAKNEEFQRAAIDIRAVRNRRFDVIPLSSRVEYELSTQFLFAEKKLLQLSQLLSEPCWIFDDNTDTFTKINVITESIEFPLLRLLNDTARGLTFRFKTA